MPGAMWSSVFEPAYSADTISVDLPTDHLKEGTNELVLTAVDEPTERDDVTNPGIFYDALELEQDPEGKFSSAEVAVQVVPTFFYRQSEEKLVELVERLIRHDSPSEDGQVQLTIAKEKFEAKLDAGWDFGDQRVEFEVPEFDARTKGEVAISLGGHTKRFPVVLDPAKKWNLFIVPHTHLDVGYTDYQAKVAEAQSRTLDEAMQLIHDHPEFRFSPDGFWCVRQFLAGRSEDERQRLFQTVEQEDLRALGGGEPSHRLSRAGNTAALALSRLRVQPRSRGRRRLCQHHRCPLLFLVLRFGAGGGRLEILCRRKRQLIAPRFFYRAACTRSLPSGGKARTADES